MKEEKKYNSSIWYIAMSILILFFAGSSISTLAFIEYPDAHFAFKLSSLFFLGLLGIVCISFTILRDRCKNEDKEENTYLDNLIQKYDGLVKLIEVKQKKVIETLKDEDESYCFFTLKTNSDWLAKYQNKLDFIKEERIRGTPDSFIEAACLIKSILEQYCVEFIYDAIPNDVQRNLIYNRLMFDINFEIAFSVAFEIISNPKTFVEVSTGNWVESSNEKVIIQVPDGIIEKNPLYNRIKRSIYKDYVAECPISEMQLANMLHLLYLYCRDCKKE